jgi:hypothetical protein
MSNSKGIGGILKEVISPKGEYHWGFIFKR